MELELTRYFVRVVQNGSFSRAAEIMKVPKSTVSKAITRLERETGTKLLLRTTRSLTLTTSGRAFYDTCLEPVQVLEDAQKSLVGRDSILTGQVRITAPEDLGNHVLAPAVGELTRRHAQLSFDLQFTDEVIDLVKDGFDMAVRIGQPRTSGLKARKVGEVNLVLVASPAYLKTTERIRAPSDLKEHDCLTLTNKSSGDEWVLRSGRENARVPIRARVTGNQMTSLLRLARQGTGIALVPSYLCRKELEAGTLARVLSEWTSPGFQVSLLSPVSLASSARLKVTSDHLFQVLQRALRPEMR